MGLEFRRVLFRSCVPAKSYGETHVDYDTVCAAGVETEDRDGEIASLGIEITSRFQIGSRVARLDRPRRRSHFGLNLELGGPEGRDISDGGVNETDEWRWTFGHGEVSDHVPGHRCNEEEAQKRARRSN